MWAWLKIAGKAIGKAAAKYGPSIIASILEARAKKAAEKTDAPKG